MEAPRERTVLIRSVLDHLRDPDRAGVLITGEIGIGKSFVATRVAAELNATDQMIRRVHGGGPRDLPLAAIARAFSNEEAYSGPAPVVSLKRYLNTLDAPMTIVVDDLDLLDTPSLAILIEVASAGLTKLILTLRAGSPIPAAVEHGVTSGSLYQIGCPPLDERSSAALADEFAGQPLSAQVHHRLFDLSRGNPLYVRELIDASLTGEMGDRTEGVGIGSVIDTVSTAPDRLVDLLEQRLRSLTDADRDALTRLALAGVSSHGEISGFVTDETLARLERRNLITTTLDGRRMLMSVAHPLDGEMIRSAASAVYARQVRAEQAERLKELGARRSHDRLRLATWALEGISTVDVGMLDEAARLAAAAGDAQLGRRCAQAAFERDATPTSAQLLGVMLTAVGDNEALRDHLPRWERLVTTPLERSQYEILSTNTRYWRWADHDAIDDLIDAAQVCSEPDSQVALRAAAASLLVTTGRINDALALADDLGDVPPGISAVHVALSLGHGWRAQGQPNRAELLVTESLDFFRAVGDDAFILSDVAMAGLLIQTLAEAGRFVELDRLIAERSESWIDLGKTPTSALVLLAQASAWFVRGEYDRSIRFATNGRVRFDEIRQIGMARWCRIMLALAHAEPGRTEEAESIIEDVDKSGDHPASIFESALARARAWTRYHRGDSAASSDLLMAAVDAELAVGNVAAAVECLHDLARQRNAPLAMARLDAIATEQLEGALYAARCAHVRAMADGDVRGLGACMAAYDRLGLRHLAAEVAMAAATIPSVTAAEARRWLRHASERTGSRTIDFSRIRAHESLTSREREVAVLAVGGLTSRQIADQLRVSRRTVESHLGNVYTKLDVDGRAGLVDRLA